MGILGRTALGTLVIGLGALALSQDKKSLQKIKKTASQLTRNGLRNAKKSR